MQTTTKRLLKVLDSKKSETSPNAFKVLNVNEYNTFKNKDEGIQAYKGILLEAYGVQSVRGHFDGKSSNSYIKIVDPNRLLCRKDIDEILKNVDDTSDAFMASRSPLRFYDVEIICSGKELDIEAYIKRTNKTQVKLTVRDILIEKEGLIFKEPPHIEYTRGVKGKTLSLSITEFISPVLLKKLDIDNKTGADRTVVENFKQIIDSVAIDVDYDGKLFNAGIIDVPVKKNDTVQGNYSHTYKKARTYTVALKVVDILGEELFETFDVTIK